MLRKLWLATVKELRLLARDREGAAILFLMPIVFVTIMSVALADFFRDDAGPKLPLVVLDADGGALARSLVEALQAQPAFAIEHRKSQLFARDSQALAADVNAAKVRFAVLLAPDLEKKLDDTLAALQPGQLLDPPAASRIAVTMLADPAVRPDHRALAESAVQRVLFGIEMRAVFARHGAPSEVTTVAPSAKVGLLQVKTEQAAGSAAPRPTSTQQNVPAYILLAMFMLVVPLSATFIREREQGTLARLRSMPVSGISIIGGKVLPYLVVNAAQVVVCLAIGRWLLPHLGADALAIGRSPAGIALLTLAASLAAIGFGLAVAMFARTIEQATAFGAAMVLIFAAIGGIMVPKTVMPEAMTIAAQWSPLGWALDGYLDLFVRGATLADILPRAGALAAFGAVMLAIAIWRFGRLVRAR